MVQDHDVGELPLGFFVEKHGKGLVDALFSTVRGSIRRALLRPGVVLKTLEDLEQVLTDVARHQAVIKPAGSEYRASYFSPTDEGPSLLAVSCQLTTSRYRTRTA